MTDTIFELKCAPSTVDLAHTLYESYIANSGGLNYQGLPCPAWADLTQAVHNHWCAVAVKAEEKLV